MNPESNNAALNRLLDVWKLQEDARAGPERRPLSDRERLVERARLYLTKAEPAVSGQHGHDQTFKVACALVKGFGLTPDESWQAVQEWNRRCRPPWDEKDLRRKLDQADKAPDERPRGWLVGACQNGSDGFVFGTDPIYRLVPNTNPSGTSKPAPEGFPLPVPASQLKPGEQATWLWRGYLSRGGVTLLAALWKSGKTTLLAYLLKALGSGGEFCGQPLDAGRALCVTEESEARWADRRDKIGLGDHVEFLVRAFTSKPSWDRWGQFLDYLVGLQAGKKYDLIVFDPLSNLWPVRDENDASQVVSALMPLHRIAEQSSLLLIHHNRKGDGQEATAARGSGALSAFVDTIVELRRYAQEDRNDRRRVLTGYGRYDETPPETVVEWTLLGEYSVHGTRADVKSRDLSDVIRCVLPVEPPGWTFSQLLAGWPADTPRPTKNRLYESLRAGADRGDWLCLGEGVKGNPHTYWKKPAEGEVPG